MPFLFRATPQHGNRRADSSLRSQPKRRQGILETTRRHPRRYETTAARDTHSTIKAVCGRAPEAEVSEFSGTYDVLASRWDDWSAQVVPDVRADWARKLDEYVSAGERVVELGCGTGVPV